MSCWQLTSAPHLSAAAQHYACPPAHTTKRAANQMAQLTTLADLTLRHADAATCGCLSALGNLNGFHTLKVFGYKLSKSALLPLTSLRALTALSVSGGIAPTRLYNKVGAVPLHTVFSNLWCSTGAHDTSTAVGGAAHSPSPTACGTALWPAVAVCRVLLCLFCAV